MESGQETQARIEMQQAYLKDVSYESPYVPFIFSKVQAPQLQVQVGVGHSVINESQNLYEVELTVKATLVAQNVAILVVEVLQAGMFHVSGADASELPQMLAVRCPAFLMPFVTEVVNGMVTKGGLPQVLIGPIDFEALYRRETEATAD